MLVGYARVSTDDQNLDMQLDALKAHGCERIFTDKASGGKFERKGLDEALSYMREGDTLVVWKLDRLGRSVKNLIQIVNELNERGIGFKSLQENMDTTSAGGKLFFHIFSALAEFEREVIRERTRAGLAAARARGREGGRPKKVDRKTLQIASTLMKDKEITIPEICERLGISKTTLYRYLNPDGTIKKNKENKI